MLDAGGLDAFQRFVKRLPEGCELRISNTSSNRCAQWRVPVSNLFWASDLLPEQDGGVSGFTQLMDNARWR